jgi:hypothetical protein
MKWPHSHTASTHAASLCLGIAYYVDIYTKHTYIAYSQAATHSQSYTGG